MLDIMFALRRLLSGDARVTDADAFPSETLTRWQSRDRQVFEIQVMLNPETFTYHLEIDHERATRRARIQEHPGLVTDYTHTLRDVIGAGFEEVRLEKVGHETRALMVGFVEQANSRTRYELRFDEISDGQRGLVLLYGLIHMARDQGYTLFLDEPENYVALREIQPWLMGLEDACGDTLAQAVISSHHPELIDYLGPNSVLLFVPTWRIETWLAYLNGETVDESRRDYPRLPRARDCSPHVDVLVDMCRRSGLRQPAPESLVAACTEWERWAAAG